MKTYTLVGMKFFESERFVLNLRDGAPVILVREKRNKHDPNAVMVCSENCANIGYVGRGRAPGEKYAPGSENAPLAAMLDAMKLADGEIATVRGTFRQGKPPLIEVDDGQETSAQEKAP